MKAYCIHLQQLTNRLPIVNKLREHFDLEIFNAIDGKTINNAFNVLPGNLGCTLSHLSIITTSKAPQVLIFEDDCEICDTTGLQDYIDNAPDYDILCLSTNENVDFTPYSDEYVQLSMFWGTHAIIITSKAVPKIVETFESQLSKGQFLPVDHLYSLAIKHHNLKAFAPTNIHRFFRQKEGLVSSITGNVRTSQDSLCDI